MNRVLDSIYQRLMCAAILALSLPFLVSGQPQDRIVDWQSVVPGSDARVLEIVDIRVNGKSITIGQSFTAGEDWLNTLTFRVRNISGKTITLFAFGVAFPEINANGRNVMLSIPSHADSTKMDSGARQPLLADEVVELKLPKDQLEMTRQISIKLMGTSNLSRVNILPGLVNFEDGSKIGGISLRRLTSEKP